jgi:G3E family GTPase
VTKWLREKVPVTRILPVRRGEVSVSSILGALPLPARHSGQAVDAGHSLFASMVLAPDGPVNAEHLAQSLAHDPNVTRAKGFVHTAGGLALIHVVGGRHSIEAVPGDHDIGVVCVGLKDSFNPDELRALVAQR